ncbi:MAG: hypothetical protein ABI949_04975 [Ilumatobacteraceae bacterium]
MDLQERYDRLRRALPVTDFDDEQVRELRDHAVEVECPAGVVLIDVDHDAPEGYVVTAGRLEVTDASGRRRLIGVDAFVDPAGASSSRVAVVKVTALDATTLLAVAFGRTAR